MNGHLPTECKVWLLINFSVEEGCEK